MNKESKTVIKMLATSSKTKKNIIRIDIVVFSPEMQKLFNMYDSIDIQYKWSQELK